MGGWVDTDGTMRELRVKLEPYIPRPSLRAVPAANLDFAQYLGLEQGQQAWMIPTLARVASGLLGTLGWYERRPRRSRPASFAPADLPTAPSPTPSDGDGSHQSRRQ